MKNNNSKLFFLFTNQPNYRIKLNNAIKNGVSTHRDFKLTELAPWFEFSEPSVVVQVAVVGTVGVVEIAGVAEIVGGFVGVVGAIGVVGVVGVDGVVATVV